MKPGKGPAYNQVELKNLINGSKLNERFRSSETVEKVRLEQKDFEFLYPQGDMLVFMDTDTYEQMELAQEFVGERAAFLDSRRAQPTRGDRSALGSVAQRLATRAAFDGVWFSARCWRCSSYSDADSHSSLRSRRAPCARPQ